MTPQERIAQIAAERGVPIPARRRRTPPAGGKRPPAAADTQVDLVADRRLPEAWKRHPADWQNEDARRAAMDRETRIAAWAITTLLGPDWRYEPSRYDSRGRYHIVHRHGHGFDIARQWNNPDRFRLTPLRRYRRDEGPPAEITVSTSRSFGSIAADIQRRMIDAGLKQAHDDDANAERARRKELATRIGIMTAVAKSAGGHIEARHRWQYPTYPEARIPGGTVRYTYDDRVEFELRVKGTDAADVAARLAGCAK